MTPLTCPAPSELNPYQRAELDTLAMPALQTHLRRESLELAYLLGAWTACTEVGGKPDTRISFASRDERQLRLLHDRILAVTGKAPHQQEVEIHGTPYQRIVLNNEGVAHHFQSVTAYNSRVPWEHLGTKAELISYIQGMFDHGGWVFTGSSAGIGINKMDGEHLLRDVSRVLAKVGLLPLIHDYPVASLRLKEITEWRLFAEKIPLSIPERQLLVHTLATRHSLKNHFTVADYETVRQGYEWEGMSPSQISRATGIPANSVRDWMIRGQKPPAVKRRDIIDGFSAGMPNPEVINLVYRTLGASSDLAIECGRRASLGKVVWFVKQVQENHATVYGNDELIAEVLLGSWAQTIHPNSKEGAPECPLSAMFAKPLGTPIEEAISPDRERSVPPS